MFGSQPGGFFVHWTDTVTGLLESIEFQYAAKVIDINNDATDCHYRMVFKEDFVRSLKKTGKAP